MRNVDELRNNIKTLGKAEHRLLELHAYLYRHPGLTGTRKLCGIYHRIVGFLKHLDARFDTITMDGFNGLFSFGDGSQAKRVFRERYYPKHYSGSISNGLLYTFYIGYNYIHRGIYSPALMTARDLADQITDKVHSPVGQVQFAIDGLESEIEQRDYIALDPNDDLPF